MEVHQPNINVPGAADLRQARLLALYLPQYHPIPENDKWWGKDYTEWVAVARGRPLFRGHEQPNPPGELGYYDLRSPETRQAQAELAQGYGVEAFLYWHYWFAGRRILEQPFNAVLKSGEPKFPFCLAWANHSWNSVWWFGKRGAKLLEQTYPGPEDDRAHFAYLLQAFSDERYLKVDGKALFYLWDPFAFPDLRRTTDLWRELAHAAGLKGLFLVGRGLNPERLEASGCDAANYEFVHRIRDLKPRLPLLGDWAYRFRVRRLLRRPIIYSYEEVLPYLLKPGRALDHDYPTVVPNWDSTPRALYSGMVYRDATPELYGRHLRDALATVAHRPLEHRLLFVKSWNEWGEGNYLEPDRQNGRALLQATRAVVYGPPVTPIGD